MNSVTLIGRLTANPTSHAGETHESADKPAVGVYRRKAS